MVLQFKLTHDGAQAPERAHQSDAGFDLRVAEIIRDDEENLWLDTGVALAIPDGYVGLVFARSSVSKKPLQLANGVGVIDSGYRGSIQVRFRKMEFMPFKAYDVGDRCAQLVLMPLANVAHLLETDELPPSDRGEGGFGSTGSN